MKKLFTLPFLCCFCILFGLTGYPCVMLSKPLYALKDQSGKLHNLKNDVEVKHEVNSLPETVSPTNDIAVSIGMTRPRPGFKHTVSVGIENKNSNSAYEVKLTLKYDSVVQMLESGFPVTLIKEGEAVFYLDSLKASEKYFILFDFYTPPNPDLTRYKTWASAAVVSSASDFDYSDNFDSTTCKIQVSGDPNSKEVFPEGFDVPNYIPVNQEVLEYTIHFQNTGSDTVYNVTIIDTISIYLDPYSIQPSASSHPFSWEILAPGILKFHFMNILLPDSNTNEPRSHGFVSFYIHTLQNLTVGINIKNSAYIYFDFNPAVTTNTTANELFDCDNISTFSLAQGLLCAGEVLTIVQNSLVPHTSMWYVDSIWHSSGDTFLFSSVVNGMHQIFLEVQTPYCSQIVSNPIQVIVTPEPVITQNGLQLSTSIAQTYQWFFNGILIPGAQSITYSVQNPGWYSVLITDAYGCDALSDSVYITSAGINNRKENAVMCSPNPFDEILFLQSNSTETIEINILSLDGKIWKSGLISSTMLKVAIDTREIPEGIYILNLSGRHFNTNQLVSKIH